PVGVERLVDERARASITDLLQATAYLRQRLLRLGDVEPERACDRLRVRCPEEDVALGILMHAGGGVIQAVRDHDQTQEQRVTSERVVHLLARPGGARRAR